MGLLSSAAGAGECTGVTVMYRGDNYFSQTLRRLRGLLVSRGRVECCWCVQGRLECRTQVVRRHSDMGLLRTSRDHSSPNDIARLIWLNKMRVRPHRIEIIEEDVTARHIEEDHIY